MPSHLRRLVRAAQAQHQALQRRGHHGCRLRMGSGQPQARPSLHRHVLVATRQVLIWFIWSLQCQMSREIQYRLLLSSKLWQASTMRQNCILWGLLCCRQCCVRLWDHPFCSTQRWDSWLTLNALKVCRYWQESILFPTSTWMQSRHVLHLKRLIMTRQCHSVARPRHSCYFLTSTICLMLITCHLTALNTSPASNTWQSSLSWTHPASLWLQVSSTSSQKSLRVDCTESKI